MKKQSFIVILIIIVQILYSQDYKMDLSEKSYFCEEKIKDTLKFISINHSYDFAYNKKYDYIILSQNFKRTQIFGWDGQISSAKIKAYINKDGKYENIWEIGGNYDTGKCNHQDLYILTRNGCCGEVPEKAYFDIITGKQVSLSNIDIVKVYDRFNKDVWYISYKMGGVDEYSNKFEDKNDGGILQIYSKKRGVIEKLLFIANDFFCPEIYFTTTLSDFPMEHTTFDYKNAPPSFINIKYDPDNVVKFSITRYDGIIVPNDFKNDDFSIVKIE